MSQASKQEIVAMASLNTVGFDAYAYALKNTNYKHFL